MRYKNCIIARRRLQCIPDIGDDPPYERDIIGGIESRPVSE